LNSRIERREVGRTKTSDRIPTRSGSVTILAALRLGALVVTVLDVEESLRISTIDLVDQRVDETKSGAALVLLEIVPQSDESSPNRSRARGAIDQLPRVVTADEVVVAESRDIRETTVGGVEVKSRGKVSRGNGGQIGSDHTVLPRGTGSESGETTTSSDQSIGVRASDLLHLSGISAGEVAADRRHGLRVGVLVVITGSGLGVGGGNQHGGTNGQNIRRSTRED